MPRDAAGYAAKLYAALHQADAASPACILIERPAGEAGGENGGETQGLAGGRNAEAIWQAVLDRLRRATTG